MGSRLNIRGVGLQSLVIVDARDTVEAAFDIVDRAGRHGALVQAEGGRFGVAGLRDLKLMAGGDESDALRPVRDIATLCPFKTRLGSDALAALAKMRRYALEVAPVWRGGDPIGVVSEQAIVRALRTDWRMRRRTSPVDPIFARPGRRRAAQSG